MKIEKESNEQIFPVVEEEEGSITLPFNEEDFKKFITGLLGKPQTIDAVIESEFELTVQNVEHIYHAIEQRIMQQNGGHLIGFNARLIFSDDSSVLVNSLPELLTFNQIKPVVCEGLHLTFQYLIKFNDKDVPEKQEINITFITSQHDNVTYNSNVKRVYLNPLMAFISSTVLHDKIGYVQYSIKHTARTWGSDIDALLANLIDGIKKPEHRILRFFRRNVTTLSFVLWVFTGVCTAYLFNQMQVNKEKIRLRAVEEVFKFQSENLQNIDGKLKFIAEKSFQPKEDIWQFIIILFGFFGGILFATLIM